MFPNIFGNPLRIMLLLIAMSTQASENFFLRGGAHEGFFLRGELGLSGSYEVEKRKPDSLKLYDASSGQGFTLGMGMSVAPRWITHVQFEVTPVSTPDLVFFSIGPALTWYTPVANTFFTGHVGYSRLSELGGDKGWRWSLSVGKELLFAEQYGIGVKLSYGRGGWNEGVAGYPSWSLGGPQIHLVATIN